MEHLKRKSVKDRLEGVFDTCMKEEYMEFKFRLWEQCLNKKQPNHHERHGIILNVSDSRFLA